MANYELMMILNPQAGEEALKASVDVVEKLLKGAKVKGLKKDEWGEKKLAYKIKGSDTGIYTLWNMELDGKALKAMTTPMNLDANIWRYMFVNLDA
jgi:small subunit ribosomal protein S6